MEKKSSESLKTISLTILIIILTARIAALPWWFFVIPVLALGLVVTLRNWTIPSFAVGLLSGFITWFGASIYFNKTLGGNTLIKIASLMSLPEFVVLIGSGLIGGLLTGLALYTGKCIGFNKKVAR